MSSVGRARGGVPSQTPKVTDDFRSRVFEALDKVRGGFEVPDLPPATRSASQPKVPAAILTKALGPIDVRTAKPMERPARLWSLVSMVHRSRIADLGISVGFGPRGRPPETALEKALWKEAERLDLIGPYKVGSGSVNADQVITRTLLAKVLIDHVDTTGKFDEAGFLAKYGASGQRLLEGLAKRAPSKDDAFGEGIAFRSLDVSLGLLFRDQPALERELLEGIGQIPKSLPAIDYVKSQVKGKPFKDYVLFGVQHLLATQAPMFKAFEDLGVKPEHIHLLGVPYSTCPLMQRYFAARGYDVYRQSQDYSRGAFHDHRVEEIRQFLGNVIFDAEMHDKKILVLDDGGLVSAVVAKEHPDKAHLFKFVEQTTRGVTEAKRLGLEWPVVNVAESSGKGMEAIHIARTVCRGLMDELHRLSIRNPAGMKLTITGYGTIGRETALMLQSLGFEVTVVEKQTSERGKKNFARAQADGFKVVSELSAVVGTTEVLLGATGHRSVTLDDIRKLPPGAIVASASSAEAEVPAEEIREAFKRPMGGPFGGTTEYFADHKSFVLVRDGRPVNFDGRLENVEPEAIQLTRGLMLLGAVQAAKEDGKGLVALDEQGPQEGLKKLVEKLWRNFTPKSIMPTEPQPESLPMPAASASPGAWEAYFQTLPEIFPKTPENRHWRDSAVFRSTDGEVWFYRRNLGETELMKLDVGKEKVSHLEFVTYDVARVTLGGEEGKQVIVNLKEQGRVLRETPTSEVKAIRMHGETMRPISAEQSGGTIRLVDDVTGKVLRETKAKAQGPSELRFLRDPPVWVAGDLSKGWHVMQMVSNPPAIELYDDKLASVRSIKLPKGVASIDRIDSEGLEPGMTVAMGRDVKGQQIVFKVDLAAGVSHELHTLPEGALLKHSIVITLDKAPIVYFLPPNTPDEEHLVTSIKL